MEAITGFNSKQLWVYDSKKNILIDPPKEVLDKIDEQFPKGDWNEKEEALDEILKTNPDWLNDKDYWYDGDDTNI